MSQLVSASGQPLESTPGVYVENSSIKEKQAYYQYDSRPFRFKQPPPLNRELVDAMKREKLDRGYRFVWGGVVIVREEPNSPSYTIARGDRNACHVVNGVVMPKYIFQRCTQARGYCYYNTLNQKVSVAREEFIPKGYISRVDYRYVDFGLLYWFLEAKANAQTLIEAGVYNEDEKVPDEEWITIMQLKANNGLYYEPGLEMIEILKRREWENQNVNLKEVARKMIEARIKRDLEQDAKDAVAAKKEWDQLFDDIMRRQENKTEYPRSL